MKYSIIIYIIFIIPLSAQDISKPSWEVGTDIRHIFKNQLYEAPYIFIRKNFVKQKPTKTQMMAHRYGLQFDIANYDNLNHLRCYSMIGKEWQYAKNKFKIAYGIDASLLFHYHNFKELPDGKYYLLEYYLIPFIGINYEVLRGVWLSGESALSMIYQQQYFEYKPMEHHLKGASLTVYRFSFSFNL